MEITTTQEVSKERIGDLLVGALEGGSNYWYMIQEKIEPKDWKRTEQTKFLHSYIIDGGALMIDDENADDPELKAPVRVDMQAIEKGLKLFANSKEYAHHWIDFIKENEDGITCDVFLQFVVFGDVIYG